MRIRYVYLLRVLIGWLDSLCPLWLARVITYFSHTQEKAPAGRGGGKPQKIGWVCGPLPKTVTLFMTKICDCPYPIYEQKLRISLPYLWHDHKFDSLFMTWPLNGGKMAKIDTILANIWKTISFGAALTYIAHIRKYPPPPLPDRNCCNCHC